MRLWSLHPKYLDSKGLLGLWRESLLAKSILLGKSIGYRHHPQLRRFKNTSDPVLAISTYLHSIYSEAILRNYSFDHEKIGIIDNSIKLDVNKNQVEYEFKHLLKKLKIRDNNKFKILNSIKKIKPNPLFNVIKGPIEEWEKVKD